MSIGRVTRGHVIVVKNCDGGLIVTAPFQGFLTNDEASLSGTLDTGTVLTGAIQDHFPQIYGMIDSATIHGYLSPSGSFYGILQECDE